MINIPFPRIADYRSAKIPLIKCKTCGGRGWVQDTLCPNCWGEGEYPESQADLQKRFKAAVIKDIKDLAVWCGQDPEEMVDKALETLTQQFNSDAKTSTGVNYELF